MLIDIDQVDKWIEVVELWTPRSEEIPHVGRLSDEAARLKFVTWASADLPELEEARPTV
jgi:hypothetical protein